MIDDDLINQLKELIILSSGRSSDSIEKAFVSALRKYVAWLHGLPAPTSTINHRLYFLQLIAEELDDDSIRKNDGIVDIVLSGSGVRAVGARFERVAPNGNKERWTVMWRQIDPKWGVEMGLRNDEGKILAGEFFD